MQIIEIHTTCHHSPCISRWSSLIMYSFTKKNRVLSEWHFFSSFSCKVEGENFRLSAYIIEFFCNNKMDNRFLKMVQILYHLVKSKKTTLSNHIDIWTFKSKQNLIFYERICVLHFLGVEIVLGINKISENLSIKPLNCPSHYLFVGEGEMRNHVVSYCTV